MGGRSSLGWYVVIAAVLHLLLYWVPARKITPSQQAKKSSEIEVEKWKDDRPVVQSSRSEKSDKDDSKALYAGQERNRFKEQMQASKRGAFNEGKVLSQRPQQKENSTEKGEPAPDNPVSDNIDQLKISDLMVPAHSPSYLGPGIKEGAQTQVNTDPVMYASFINRMSDEIHSPWEEHARFALQELSRSGYRFGKNQFVTKLGIKLDGDGRIISIQVLKGSGLDGLDDAPKKALWEKEPFPNPPEQLFDTEGLISLVFEFNVQTGTSFFNIVPWRI